MTGNCYNCEPLDGGSLVTINQAQQPFCDQCSDDNSVCGEKMDSRCVVYHLRDLSLPTNLRNIGAVSGDSVENILEKIDALIGNKINIPITNSDSDSPSIDITLSGAANHTIKADVKVSPDAGNALAIRNNGVYVPVDTGKVKVDSTDAADYLENQIIGDTDSCVSISVQKRDGILYIKPTFNFACFLQQLHDNHFQDFCDLIQGCNCYLRIMNTGFSIAQACPDGYTLVNGLCQQTISQPATPSGTEYNLQVETNAVWSKGGTLIFKNGFNLNGSGPGVNFAADIGSGDVVQVYTPNVWLNGTSTPFGGGNTPLLGPMNRTAVWSNPYNADTTFVVPVNVPTSKEYYIGLGVDNVASIMITAPNGAIGTVLQQDTAAASPYYTGSTTWNFDLWNIYPVYLTAGINYITVNGHDIGVAFGFGIEIYDATIPEIQAAALAPAYLADPSTYPYTSNAYSNLNVIFSSRCARQAGSISANSATCPDSSWTLDVTTGSTPTSPCQGINNPVVNWTCKKILTTPFVGYSIDLSWDRIPSAISYTVEQKLHSQPDSDYSLTVGSPFANPTDGSTVTETINNLPSSTMDFRVKANFSSCSTDWTVIPVS